MPETQKWHARLGWPLATLLSTASLTSSQALGLTSWVSWPVIQTTVKLTQSAVTPCSGKVTRRAHEQSVSRPLGILGPQVATAEIVLLIEPSRLSGTINKPPPCAKSGGERGRCTFHLHNRCQT